MLVHVSTYQGSILVPVYDDVFMVYKCLRDMLMAVAPKSGTNNDTLVNGAKY